jgi:CHAT domain-containing protein
VVSKPASDRRRHPELSPLPWTAEEASHAAALYPDVVLVGDRDATAETFLRKAPGFDIVHFLGHATRTSMARGSCLVLAPRPGVADSDLLCGRELEGLRLDRTRLVILSACGTADGYVARGEGIASLARSFLAAGAPAVIGTSWNVKDQTASLFLSALHRGLRSGTDPAAALRSTQLGYIGSPKLERSSPRFWANFQLTGGTR